MIVLLDVALALFVLAGAGVIGVTGMLLLKELKAKKD